MLYRSLVVFFVAVLLGGCAIHPLPENVTGIDTPDIVRQIRCEAREAVIHEVKKWLTSLAADSNPRTQLRTRIAQQLLAKYDAEPESISSFNAGVFPASFVAERQLVNLFYTAGIGYSFDLKMTENNDINPASATLLRPSPPQPKFTLGLGAGALFDRTNQRKFTATDTFGSLLRVNAAEVRGRRYCTGFVVTENYIYPIAGRLGVG